VELRFHSPYRHWLVGLLTEVVLFLGFIALAALLALAAAWIA
jgi:hypothetical protein